MLDGSIDMVIRDKDKLLFAILPTKKFKLFGI